MTDKKTKRPKGVQVAVSPKAHKMMVKKAVNSVPRLDLRGVVNQFNGLDAKE